MRHLEDTSPAKTTPVVYVPMRGKYDCMTCVTAMLLGISYEEVETAFGGNIDPSKNKQEESQRLYWAYEKLIQKHNRGALNHLDAPELKEGRRYWVSTSIDDPANPLSKEMSHTILVDESGKVFDPNPQYGVFKSYAEWSAAMTLPHEIDFVQELYEYSL
jgi:hypothetical protein